MMMMMMMMMMYDCGYDYVIPLVKAMKEGSGFFSGTSVFTLDHRVLFPSVLPLYIKLGLRVGLERGRERVGVGELVIHTSIDATVLLCDNLLLSVEIGAVNGWCCVMKAAEGGAI